ncbi:Six-hairpin glycosidase protein [Raphanus sativus]|nr:Six-hairpin glycosidase protein [Raphanus sativus]
MKDPPKLSLFIYPLHSRRLDVQATSEQPTTRNRHNILAHNLRQLHESHTTHIPLRNSVTIVPDALISLSKQQVDYILGNNPIKMSYMVGFGPSFPMRIHHRASSLTSRGLLSKPFNCTEGFQFYHTQNPNPNILTGAIVGGPDKNDEYPDKRDEYIYTRNLLVTSTPPSLGLWRTSPPVDLLEIESSTAFELFFSLFCENG